MGTPKRILPSCAAPFMFLDLDNGQRGIGSVAAEVYFDYAKGSHITYWFF